MQGRAVVYLLVAALVFAEDAPLVGFVMRGETAAVLGWVDAQPRTHPALADDRGRDDAGLGRS